MRDLLGEVKTLGQYPNQCFGAVRGVHSVIDVAHDDGEFVATEACYGVALAQTTGEPPPGLDQQSIADRVAQCIVDVLETIKVDEQQGELATVALRLTDGLQRADS